MLSANCRCMFPCQVQFDEAGWQLCVRCLKAMLKGSEGLTKYMPVATATTATRMLNFRLCLPGFLAASLTSSALSAQQSP